jgi:hypothetical protein
MKPKVINYRLVLTEHAINRILSREKEEFVVNITMTPAEVIDFLIAKIYVKATQQPIIGKKYCPDTQYMLFYSPQDDYFYIAIGRKHKKFGLFEVFTVIPANKKGKWMITKEMLQEAKNMACKALSFYLINFNQHDKVPSLIKVSCSYKNHGGEEKIKKLFHVNANAYRNNPENLTSEHNFIHTCIEFATKYSINKKDISTFIIRFGSRGDPILIENNYF